MCGIVGQFSIPPQGESTEQVISDLTNLMTRRGPDDAGYWTDGRHCALGFRRLSILDLTPFGNQPMLTPDGRFALVINGEVYNFVELRAELQNKGWQFRSSGDAEVVLFALAEWGKAALDRFNGMFALAFYDSLEKSLLLARDHVGSKPLYYLKSPQGLVFASQYDQIMTHPWSKGLAIDQAVLSLYMVFGYIPAPYAILDQTHLLEAGSWLEVDTTGNYKTGRYFDFPKYQEPDLFGAEAFEAVDAALVSAVKRQMVSDVPLGCFLSGGIDSPLITAIAQSLSTQPVKAFTIGVENSPLDESEDARRYAQQIGVEHYVENIRFDQVVDLIGDVNRACSEPFGDYSIFPTLLNSRFASKQVKVMLSGDGGDELFWGYTGRMGGAIRHASLFKYPFWARKVRWHLFRPEGDWASSYFRTPGRWYRSFHEHNFEGILRRFFPDLAPFPESYLQYDYAGNNEDGTAQWVRWNEFTGHMGNGMLKVDRGSMYNSLEVRTPLLDREVISVSQRVDWRTCLDIKNDIGKIPLRQALSKRLDFQSSGKRGFTVPMDEWLRGPLKEMMFDLVINRQDLLGLRINKDNLSSFFQDHLDGKNWAWGLWILLSLALWEDRYLKRLS